MSPEKKPLPTESVSRKKASASGFGCLLIFFGIFLAMGLFFFAVMVVLPLWNSWRSENWVATPCEVVSSEVVVHDGDDSDTYSVRVVYKYNFQGQPLQGDKYDFTGGSSSGRGGKQAIVDQYPPGRKATCYVNPENPSEAVIERGARELWWGMLPLVFVAVGLGGVAFAVRGWLRSGAATEVAAARLTPLSGAGVKSSVPTSTVGWLPAAAVNASSGALMLRPQTTRTGNLIAVIVICLFWNGILSVFLFSAVRDFARGGAFEWFMALFLTPFVLVGVALIFGVFYTFLATFNPVAELRLTPGLLRLGEPFDVMWTFAGNTSGLRQLKIVLRGHEEARYTRGTSTYTDRSLFAEITLLDTFQPANMPQGTARSEIPAGCMHSFEAANNKILWTLEIQGEIAFWPNVKDTYNVVVMPRDFQPEGAS